MRSHLLLDASTLRISVDTRIPGAFIFSLLILKSTVAKPALEVAGKVPFKSRI
jgi:hypothetical protein